MIDYIRCDHKLVGKDCDRLVGSEFFCGITKNYSSYEISPIGHLVHIRGYGHLYDSIPRFMKEFNGTLCFYHQTKRGANYAAKFHNGVMVGIECIPDFDEFKRRRGAVT